MQSRMESAFAPTPSYLCSGVLQKQREINRRTSQSNSDTPKSSSFGSMLYMLKHNTPLAVAVPET